ncbi:MAG: hypothetical protein ACI9OJ_002603 [Myxococcota bacterium]|jgi:hypothetical protein
MSQFEVIRDINETLKELLKDSFKRTGFTTVTVSTDRPKKDNIKNMPTVSCYMYHVGFHPGYKERTDSLVSSYDRDGNIVEYYQDAPVYMFAHFIISVWGNSPNEENLLLGLAIKTVLEHPIMTRELLKGESWYPDDRINVYPNLQADFNDTLSFWRSLNEELRPSVYYFVRFRIESDRKSGEARRVTDKDFSVR